MIYSLKYTDDMKDWQGGYAKAWFIRIRPAYQNDKGLFAHEMEHVKQFWRTFGLHGLLYLTCDKYKLNSEVEAYKEQLKFTPASLDYERYRDMYAGFIADDYNLDISKGDVLKIL